MTNTNEVVVLTVRERQGQPVTHLAAVVAQFGLLLLYLLAADAFRGCVAAIAGKQIQSTVPPSLGLTLRDVTCQTQWITADVKLLPVYLHWYHVW